MQIKWHLTHFKLTIKKDNRQLQTAQQVPSLTAVGGALEDIQRQQNMAPQQSLAQYYNTVAPIAYGLPTQQQTSQAPQANAMGMAAGGAMSGAAMGNMMAWWWWSYDGCSCWWSWWIIRRVIIMSKLINEVKHYYKDHKKAVIAVAVILVIAIIL